MNISNEADAQKRNALNAEEVSHEFAHLVTLMYCTNNRLIFRCHQCHHYPVNFLVF